MNTLPVAILNFVIGRNVVIVCIGLLVAPVCAPYPTPDSGIVGVVKSAGGNGDKLDVVTLEGIEIQFQVETGTTVHNFIDRKVSSNETLYRLPKKQPPSDSVEDSEIGIGPRSSTGPSNGGSTRSGIEALLDKEGRDVVVLFTRQGRKLTAVSVEELGHQVLRKAEGGLIRVDTGEAVVRTHSGEVEAFELVSSPPCITPEGLADVREVLKKKDTHVMVYYSDQRGRKVAHLIRTNRLIQGAFLTFSS